MNKSVVLAIALCGFGGLACVAHGEGIEVKGDAAATVASSYFWRGKQVNDSTVLQPQITVGIDRWAMSVWGTWNVNGESELSARSRIDAQVDYGFDWKKIQLKGGAVVRTYHGDPANMETDTYEIYLQAAAVDVPFYPSITLYYDLGDMGGFYASLAAGETWEVREDMDVVLDIRLGLASSGFTQKFFAGPSAGDDGDTSLRGGLVDLSVCLSLPLTCKKFIITPRVEYVTLVDSGLRDAAEAGGRDADGVIGSLTVSRSF